MSDPFSMQRNDSAMGCMSPMENQRSGELNNAEPSSAEPSSAELCASMEFGCWSALVMAPVIYWLQGPSVSIDQQVVRTALIVIAATGAICLRARALWCRFRRKQDQPPHT